VRGWSVAAESTSAASSGVLSSSGGVAFGCLFLAKRGAGASASGRSCVWKDQQVTHTHTDREQHPRQRHTHTHTTRTRPQTNHPPQTLNNARRCRDCDLCGIRGRGGSPRSCSRPPVRGIQGRVRCPVRNTGGEGGRYAPCGILYAWGRGYISPMRNTRGGVNPQALYLRVEAE